MPAAHDPTTENDTRGASSKGPDEASRRRPGFREGTPIKMADGQVWHVPKPRPVLIAKVGEEVNPRLARLGGDLARIRSVPVLEDPVYMDLMEILGTAIQGGKVVKVHGAATAAVVRLLMRNYDLSMHEAIGLIPPLDGSAPAAGLSGMLNAVLGVPPLDTAA